jgi:RNA polymerase sigma-70 factor (ECF subfamily)
VLILKPRPSGAPAPSADSPPTADDLFPPELREALRAREPQALERFYDGYFDRLYGYVWRMVGEEHLAEDLTQEVFMHLLSNLENYDPARPLRPWVFAIATNKVRDFWRSRRHRMGQREVSLDLDEAGGWYESSTARPDEELVTGERTDSITAAIEAIPESMRLTLVLRYYEELSFEQIGRIVGRNEAAVRKRYSRALEELRKILGGPDAQGASTGGQGS